MDARVKTDEDVLVAFNLAKKLYENLKEPASTQITVSDAEFTIICNCLANETVLVRARFLEMVSENNE